MENCERKGMKNHVETYSKLLSKLEHGSSDEIIEKEVNTIIDSDKERVKELKEEIKRLEKEIGLLSRYSKRETDLDVSMIITNL